MKSETIMNFLKKLNSNRKKYTIEILKKNNNVVCCVYEDGISKFMFSASAEMSDEELENLFNYYFDFYFDFYANKNKVLN